MSFTLSVRSDDAIRILHVGTFPFQSNPKVLDLSSAGREADGIRKN